ncbi:MAG: COX15/CtaA family protein [Marmoricola sp.]
MTDPATGQVPVARAGTVADLSRHLHAFGWASIATNVLLVVTGGAVRLTASGLGCPTWPQCHAGSFTPRGEMNIHSAIEFGNRTLTFVLAAVAILTFVAAWQSRRRELRWLAFGIGMAIPAQAVLGGISVLTDLNPWVVSLHLLSSLVIITVAVVFLWRIDRRLPRPAPLAWAMFAAAWAVLYMGTVVTGAGPHAGNAHSPRNGLSTLQTSQLHADLVFLFLGLTIGLLFVVRRTAAQRPVVVLLAVSLAQGVVGFVQYFTGLPIVAVGFHMLGAALVVATATWALLTCGRPAPVRGDAAADARAEAAAGGH